MNQLRTAELKSINEESGGNSKTSQLLTAYLEGVENPRLSLSDRDAFISMFSVQSALFDAAHAGHLATARRIAIFALFNSDAVKPNLPGEVTAEWLFEEACLTLWLCERYPDYPELIRACWPGDKLGEVKAKDKKSENLARFITLYFAERSKNGDDLYDDSLYIRIQLYLSTEDDAVLKLLMERKAVHVIGDLIARHHGKDSDIVSFELYCDLLRLPFSSERYQEGIYFSASKFFGSIGDEKRERLALTKTTEYRWDIFFDELQELDRKKGNSIKLVEDVICYAIRTGEYEKLRRYLGALPTNAPLESR